MSNSNTNLQTQTSSVLQNDTVSSCSISNIQEKTQLSRSRCMHSLKEIKSLFKFLSETLQDYGTMPIFKRTFSQDLDLLEQHLTKDERYMENYKNVSQDIRDQMNAEAEAVQIILTGIDNDIYSTVDACPNACEILENNTSRDGESLESYYSRFYKMMNELVRNQCNVTNHQVNVQFLLQLQPEWQRFVTLVKQSQELKTVSYHKLYDILKQHQNEVNEIRTERLARTANPLALVAQQQPVYHPPNHPTQNTQYSSTRTQQSTRNRGKAIVTSSAPTYDPEPATVTEDEEMSKEKEIDKLMALISLSFKKIYKPTNNNLRTSSNTSRTNQDNSPRTNRGTGYDNQRAINVAGARENVGTPVVQKSGIQCYNCKEYGHVSRECQKPKRVKDAAYHKEKMLLCKQEEAGVQLNAEQADWKDDTDDESDEQELEVTLIYEVDNLKSQMETQKTQFLNEIDRLSREYYYADHMNAILGIYTDLDEFTDLQCDYGETLEKCERLEKELSKKKIKQDKSFKENQSKVFLKEREQYFEIQDLKAQLQNKGIAICELKKLIEKMKGKSVETKFEKSSVIRQPNAFKSQRQSILGKPAIFSDSLAKKDFSKSKPVTTQNVSNDFSKPVTAQILPQNKLPIVKNTNVIAPGMYKVHTKPNHTRTPQLHQDIRKPNKRVSFSTGVIPNTSVSRPQLKGNHLEDRVMSNNSQGKKQEVEDHRRKFKFVFLSLQDSTSPNPICLMAKATSSQAWLWHRRLSHLNFDTINLLSKNNIVNGLPKLKFVKVSLGSSC
ncbi:retrovirus-related pol polyprotein from transposon TNT 1-94 [Tanacetum coccineum]